MKVIITTPEQSTTMEEVQKVTLPGSQGPFTVLRRHAPLISALRKGVVCCDQKEVAVEAGVVRVKKDVITIITEHAS